MIHILKNKALRYFLSLFIPCIIQAQVPSVAWAQMIRTDGQNTLPNTFSHTMALDAHENLFVTGSFVYTAIIGNDTLSNPVIGHDIFFAKYDSTGNPLWAQSFGGNNFSSDDYGYALTTDATGNCIITGVYDGDTLAIQTITTTGNSNYNLFIAKFDPNGNILWAKTLGACSIYEKIDAISTDAAGNIYVAGVNSCTMVIAGTTLPWSVYGKGFLAKYDPSGNALWASSISHGVAGHSEVYAMVSDPAGNCYLTGGFSDSLQLGNSVLLANPNQIVNTFIIKYNSSGNRVWQTSFAGCANQGSSIALDSFGNFFCTGYYTAPMTIGNSSLSCTTSNSAFVAKCDTSGHPLWAKCFSYGPNVYGMGRYVATDASGNCYVAGDHTQSVIIGSTTLSGSNGGDIYLAELDPQGNAVWAMPVHCTSPYSKAHAFAMICSPVGNCYLSGTVRQSISVGTYPLNNGGGDMPFVTRLNKYYYVAGMEPLVSTKLLDIFPNPANDVIYINHTEPWLKVNLFDMKGSLLKSLRLKNDERTIDLRGMRPGMYFLQMQGERVAEVKKIIIE